MARIRLRPLSSWGRSRLLMERPGPLRPLFHFHSSSFSPSSLFSSLPPFPACLSCPTPGYHSKKALPTRCQPLNLDPPPSPCQAGDQSSSVHGTGVQLSGELLAGLEYIKSWVQSPALGKEILSTVNYLACGTLLFQHKINKDLPAQSPIIHLKITQKYPEKCLTTNLGTSGSAS